MKVLNGIQRFEIGDIAIVKQVSYGVTDTIGHVVEVTELGWKPKDPDIRAYVHSGDAFGATYWYAPSDLVLLNNKNS